MTAHPLIAPLFMEKKIRAMPRFLCVWVGAMAVAIGCQPTTESPTGKFGQFIGDVVASWDDDGRQMTLRETFAYVDPQQRRWVAPAGSVVNGASIPFAFWSVIGGPFEGKYRNASVVHDVGCVEMQQPWEDVHRMFYEARRCGGVDDLQAKMLYYAVYHFGPRWHPVTETVVEQRETPDGQMVAEEVTVRHMARVDPLPPTSTELEKVEAYIVEENPSTEAIQSFRRDALRRRPTRHRDRPLTLSTTRDATSPGGGRSVSPSGRNRQAIPGRLIRAAQVGETNLPAVTTDQRQWAIEQVRQYIEQQAGEPRLAEYTVDRVGGSFRVLVQLLHKNEQGQIVADEGGNCTVRLSRRGEILEFISGARI